MEIIITLLQSILLFVAAAALIYTFTKFVLPLSKSKGKIFLLRNAHNVYVNNSKNNPTFSMAGESTDGWGASHMDIDVKENKTVKSFFYPSKTRVNTFGAQSRPHGYGWTPSS